jgi:hypothetical protein
MSNKEKPKANITIEVYDESTVNHTSGNSYYCIVGLAVAVNSVIEGLPKAIQEAYRAEFLRLLNEATSGRLFLEE